MGCSFLCVYPIYAKIERGSANFSDGIRYLVGFIVLCLGTGLFAVPFLLLMDEGSFINKLLEVLGVYIGGVIVIAFLLTILSWLNNNSPWKELKVSLRLL